MTFLQAKCVRLLTVVSIAVLLSSAAATAQEIRERRNWYAADGSWFVAYKYGRDFELQLAGRPLIAGKVTPRDGGFEIRQNGRSVASVDAEKVAENSLILTVTGRATTFHKISGDWYANDEAGGPRVLRLSPMYLNWELYRKGEPLRNARYRFDGQRLLVSDGETGRPLGNYGVELEGDKLTLEGRPGTVQFDRLGGYEQERYWRVIRAWDPKNTTQMGVWAANTGDMWEVRERHASLYQDGKEVLIAEYRFDGNAIEFKNWPDYPRFAVRYGVHFANPNLMVWDTGERPITLYWQREHQTRSIGMYDIDAYRISPDFFAGRPQGGYSSWCMPNCGLAAPLFDVDSFEAAMTVIENSR